MRSKSEAIEHIKQVREAFAPMMEQFEKIFHAQWENQERFMQMLLGAARPLRLLPNPSRLYRESQIPTDKICSVICGAGSVAMHLHHQRAISQLIEKLPGMPGAPSVQEVTRQLEEQERLYEKWQREGAFPEVPLDEYFSTLPEDLRPLLGAIQGDDVESIYCLANWGRLVELNADHILVGRSKKFSALPLEQELSHFLWSNVKLAPRLVMRRYDDAAAPEEARHIFDFVHVLVGAYGNAYAVKLLLTATLLSDWSEGLADESRRMAQECPAMIRKLARATGGDVGLAALRAFREGISTLLFSIAMLTAERMDRFDDPVLLAAEVVQQSLPTRMAALFPPLIIGPLGITGGYLTGFVKDYEGQLGIDRGLMTRISQLQSSAKTVEGGLPATGYGCPLAYPVNGDKPQIDTLAKLFMVLLIQVDILGHEIQKTMLAEAQ